MSKKETNSQNEPKIGTKESAGVKGRYWQYEGNGSWILKGKAVKSTVRCTAENSHWQYEGSGNWTLVLNSEVA